MAHFAELDKNNQVINIVVVSNDDIKDMNGNEVEEIGIAFCKKLFGADTNWKQTSYNNNMRVRYAIIDGSYNEELDTFIPPKPFESWVINIETKDWESPIGEPPELTQQEIDSGSFYQWNEENGEWALETLTSPEE